MDAQLHGKVSEKDTRVGFWVMLRQNGRTGGQKRENSLVLFSILTETNDSGHTFCPVLAHIDLQNCKKGIPILWVNFETVVFQP